MDTQQLTAALAHSLPVNLLVASPGSYRGPVGSYSHFNEAVSAEPGIHGKSRNWGDINQSGQRQIVAQILNESTRAGLTLGEAAFALAVARTESGFNPDAASGISSAAGIGQFLDSTNRGFGVADSERFSAATNIRAMLHYLRQTLAAARKKGAGASAEQVWTRAFALYHDGPQLHAGGAQIAQKQVVPWAERYADWLCGALSQKTPQVRAA